MKSNLDVSACKKNKEIRKVTYHFRIKDVKRREKAQKDLPDLLHFMASDWRVIKKNVCSGHMAQIIGVSSYTLKSCGFDFGSCTYLGSGSRLG